MTFFIVRFETRNSCFCTFLHLKQNWNICWKLFHEKTPFVFYAFDIEDCDNIFVFIEKSGILHIIIFSLFRMLHKKTLGFYILFTYILIHISYTSAYYNPFLLPDSQIWMETPCVEKLNIFLSQKTEWHIEIMGWELKEKINYSQNITLDWLLYPDSDDIRFMTPQTDELTDKITEIIWWEQAVGTRRLAIASLGISK